MVISLVEVDKKCHMGGGGGLKSAEKVSHIIWMAPNYANLGVGVASFIGLAPFSKR